MKQKYIVVMLIFLLLGGGLGCWWKELQGVKSPDFFPQFYINRQRSAVDLEKQQLFFPIKSIGQKQSFHATLEYKFKTNVLLSIEGNLIESGSQYFFTDVTPGDTIPLTFEERNGKKQTYSLIFTALPILSIQADEKIRDDKKQEATFSLVSNTPKQDIEHEVIKIKVRGRFSKKFKKKSFNIEFQDKQNKSKGVLLLDLRSDDDWILDASYIDPTFVRNRVSHDLFLEMFENPYHPQKQSTVRGRLVEIVMNGRYHGIYILSEKVDRRLLNLQKQGSALYKAQKQADFDKSNANNGFELKYPKETKKNDAVRAWKPMMNFVKFIISTDKKTFEKQIRSQVYLESIINFHLLLLLTAGRDNHRQNFYFARNQNDPMFIVPWDFDATFGINFRGKKKVNSDSYWKVKNDLIERLMELEGYQSLLKWRWIELRDTLFAEQNLIQRFNKYHQILLSSGAYQRNFKRWKMGNFKQLNQQSYITQWISQRLQFLDKNIKNL